MACGEPPGAPHFRSTGSGEQPAPTSATTHHPPDRIRPAGVTVPGSSRPAAACATCAAPLGRNDHFCTACGNPIGAPPGSEGTRNTGAADTSIARELLGAPTDEGGSGAAHRPLFGRLGLGLVGVGLAGLVGLAAFALLSTGGDSPSRVDDAESADPGQDLVRPQVATTQSSETAQPTEVETTVDPTTTETPRVERAAGGQNAPVHVDGQPLTPMPAGVLQTGPETDPSYGALAPTLVGTDFEGDEVVIAPNGTPKAIYFLAHWCPHCQREAPLVQDLVDRGRVPAGLEIYAVSTAVAPERGNYPVSAWLLGDVGFTSPIVQDDADSTALAAFGTGGLPFVVYLDSSHRVVARSAGEIGQEAMAEMWSLATEPPDTVVDELFADGRYLEQPTDSALDATIGTANEANIGFVWLDRSGGSVEATALADDYVERLSARGSPMDTVLVLLDNGYAASSLTVSQSVLDRALNSAFEGFSNGDPDRAVAAFVAETLVAND